jgi:RTX calcium-binding nonapeptide repeat (4 copies)
MKRVLLSAALVASAIVLIPQTASAAPQCHGHKANIVGTRSGEWLFGTGHRDIIVGLGGGDSIVGRGGNDLICGSSGGDVIDGGTGVDDVYGGPGTDACAATTPREHSHHHQCEAHNGAPLPGGGGDLRLGPERPAAPSATSAPCSGAYCGAVDQSVADCNYAVGQITNLTGFVRGGAMYGVRAFYYRWAGSWIFEGYDAWSTGQLDGSGDWTWVLWDPITANPSPSYWAIGMEWQFSDDGGQTWYGRTYTYSPSYKIWGGDFRGFPYAWCYA